MSRTRKPAWASLPDDLLELIQKRLELPDYKVFGMVCQSWRQAAARTRFQPLTAAPWAMVTHRDVRSSPYLHLYCRSRQTVFKLELPTNIRQCHVRGAYGGWVILLYPRKPRLSSSRPTVILYNPFSRQKIRPRGPRRGWPADDNDHVVSINKLILSSPPDNPHSALVCSDEAGNVYCRWMHRDDSFKLTNFEGDTFVDIVSHSGTVYLMTESSYKLVRLELTQDNLSPDERCVLVIKNSHLLINLMNIHGFLIHMPPMMILSEWGDDLILHHIGMLRAVSGTASVINILFRANFSEGRWESYVLGDERAVLVSFVATTGHSTALPATDWGLRRNCIYREGCWDSWLTDGTVIKKGHDDLDQCFVAKSSAKVFHFDLQWISPSY